MSRGFEEVVSFDSEFEPMAEHEELDMRRGHFPPLFHRMHRHFPRRRRRYWW